MFLQEGLKFNYMPNEEELEQCIQYGKAFTEKMLSRTIIKRVELKKGMVEEWKSIYVQFADISMTQLMENLVTE
jgi:hypothetical protein